MSSRKRVSTRLLDKPVAMKVVVLVLSFVGLALSMRTVSNNTDHLGLEQPIYKLNGIQPADHSYQVRTYEQGRWATTHVYAIFEEEAKLEGFKRLYDYISGGNDRGIEMNMTLPFITEIVINPHVFLATEFRLSFYIPSIYQAKPPVPTDENVWIWTRSITKFYVRSLNGEVMPESSIVETYRLSQDLKRNNISEHYFHDSVTILAEYNNPMEKWYHRKEIWLQAFDRA